MITSFGKFTRKLRIDKEEHLSDMARRLNVSPAFLSRVEHGDAKPPKHWERQIIELYNLQGKLAEEFTKCFRDAISGDSINISSFSEQEKEIIRTFANKLHDLDATTLSSIYNLLQGEKEDLYENRNTDFRSI